MSHLNNLPKVHIPFKILKSIVYTPNGYEILEKDVPAVVQFLETFLKV